MPSLLKLPPLDRPVDVTLVKAHMASSLGVDKAGQVVDQALSALSLPTAGELTGLQATQLLERISAEPGLIGLAAKVTRQMVRVEAAPLKPAF